MGDATESVAIWQRKLADHVSKKPIVVLRFTAEEWISLELFRRGTHEFTIARPHAMFRGTKAATACIFEGHGSSGGKQLYFGVLSSLQAVTTLDSRIKVKRALRIAPHSEAALGDLIVQEPHSGNLESRLKEEKSVIVLSSKLSSHIVERLASIEENHGAMRVVSSHLSVPKRFRGGGALQEDAVRTALRAFGLSADDQAISVQLARGETSLARVSTMEDSVIEHDARAIPGYDLMESTLTGRALFERGNERLEVFTANRRSLERVLGVDLIYLNLTRQNVVMLQYKMLEPSGRGADNEIDWIYRPDDQLEAEISRMERFSQASPPRQFEYRLNPAVFYLKFVKRDASLRNGGIITPIDHYHEFSRDPACFGRNGGLRVSYNSLAGRYLRQGAFLDLIRSGYVGAHAETTKHIKTLIDAVLNGDRALVAAIQTVTEMAPDSEVDQSDGEHF